MFAKVLLLCSVAIAVNATGINLVSTGVSTTSRRQDSDGNYEFKYDIVDAQGATNSRSEVGDAHGNKQGSYSLRDTDGRSRTVDYIADNQGFRAVVKTNEQGTAFSAPAAVVIDSPYDEPKAPEPVAVEAVELPNPVVAPVAPALVVPSPIAPVARPPPVAHPAPVAPVVHPFVVAPFGKGHSSHVNIIHTVPVRVAHVFPVASPFMVRPVLSPFGFGHNFMGVRGIIYGKH